MRRRPSELVGHHGYRAGFRLRMDERDDSGFTLVELMIASLLFVTVGTLVSLSLDTFLNVSNVVHSSYANTQQILPVSTNIQRLIRSEVEPGPIQSGVPSPPFLPGAVSSTSMTFYANVGVAGRPAKVVAQLNAPTLNATTSTFTVTDQLADAGTCPSTTNPSWTCKFNNNPAKRVASITNVVNWMYPPSTGTTTTTTPPTPQTPVFTYIVLNAGGTQCAVPPVVGSVPPACTAVGSIAATFGPGTCTGTGDACYADEVQGVEVDLYIKSPGSKSLKPAEDDTIVYRLSSTSYLYSPTVG
jgi:prepilin-type N-terminal cleavage/methylation domain-containing protein